MKVLLILALVSTTAVATTIAVQEMRSPQPTSNVRVAEEIEEEYDEESPNDEGDGGDPWGDDPSDPGDDDPGEEEPDGNEPDKEDGGDGSNGNPDDPAPPGSTPDDDDGNWPGPTRPGDDDSADAADADWNGPPSEEDPCDAGGSEDEDEVNEAAFDEEDIDGVAIEQSSPKGIIDRLGLCEDVAGGSRAEWINATLAAAVSQVGRPYDAPRAAREYRRYRSRPYQPAFTDPILIAWALGRGQGPRVAAQSRSIARVHRSPTRIIATGTTPAGARRGDLIILGSRTNKSRLQVGVMASNTHVITADPELTPGPRRRSAGGRGAVLMMRLTPTKTAATSCAALRPGSRAIPRGWGYLTFRRCSDQSRFVRWIRLRDPR